MSLYQNAGRLKFAALLCAALAIGACAKTPGEEGLAGLGAGGGGGYGNGHGSGAPGSAEDFAQNAALLGQSHERGRERLARRGLVLDRIGGVSAIIVLHYYAAIFQD